ncbi:MAG: 2-isopropylmalate synthase, partial [Clostridia bacterium]|nr:2-isopropylmalate synthase [Clostridia bacterium]
MIFYNTHKHLLQEQTYSYSLQDVAEPNLFREFFDYENVPRTAFDFFTVPMNTPESLWITDTTFRDGQQSMHPFTVEQIVDLYKMLHRLGGKKGIVKQSEFFLYSEKDRAAVRACQELGYEFPEITSWIRATDSDFELVKEMGIKETGILVSCSDYHIFNKLHLTRAQAMDKYLSIVKKALD